MGWKYVVITNKLADYPIIFPDKLVHIEVATVCRLIVPTIDKIEPMPVSAGDIGYLEVEGIGGWSSTLQMNSRPIDERLINTYPYLHGIKGAL